MISARENGPSVALPCAAELGIQNSLWHHVAVGLAAMSTLTTRDDGEYFEWLSGALVASRAHNPEVPGSNPGVAPILSH